LCICCPMIPAVVSNLILTNFSNVCLLSFEFLIFFIPYVYFFHTEDEETETSVLKSVSFHSKLRSLWTYHVHPPQLLICKPHSTLYCTLIHQVGLCSLLPIGFNAKCYFCSHIFWNTNSFPHSDFKEESKWSILAQLTSQVYMLSQQQVSQQRI